MPRFKSIILFIKIALKLSFICKKMQNFRALNPRASGGWGLCPQTSVGLRQLGASPPDPIGLRRLEAQPPDPQNSPPL